MIELLAPVGSHEALVAAVESGANAVYLAGEMFGARAYADNFDRETLKEAIQFAHMRDVLVNVTVNTIVDNDELDELANYLRFLYEAGTDAILVQDLGVVKLAREIVPELPLHASTQMTVHNLSGVLALENLGFTRVVLSRELSLEDIRYICSNSHIEIEVFVHGALCVCYSGQCLMSSMLGGRSGNRGRCAQPCRLPYTLLDEDENNVLEEADAGQYLLSPRDMNTIDILPELIDSGVASLKIEGRMKRPEYVAVVVDTYRRAIDSYLLGSSCYEVSEKDHKELMQIFNRDFTTAYLQNRPGRFMMSDHRPNNRGVLAGRVIVYNWDTKEVTIKLSESLHEGDQVDFWVKVGGRVTTTIKELYIGKKQTSSAVAGEEVTFVIPAPVRDHDRVFKVFDAQMMERARKFFNTGAPVRRIPVDVEIHAAVDEPLVLCMMDDDGYSSAIQTSFIGQKAVNRPLTVEVLKKQISRLGSTVFELRDLKCTLAGDVMIPISVLNDARRDAADMLVKKRLEKFKRLPLMKKADVWTNVFAMPTSVQIKKPELVVSVDSVDKVKSALEAGADWILFGGESYNHSVITVEEYKEVYDLVKKAKKKISFNTPRIVSTNQVKALQHILMTFREFSLDAVNVHNIGSIQLVKDCLDVPIHADFSLVTFNNLSIEFLHDLGIASLTLSPELNMRQVENIAAYSTLPLECVVHGNLELMVSEYCIMGSFLGNIDKNVCSQMCMKKKYVLKDRKNEQFPLVTDQFCHMHLLNGKELSMLPHVSRFAQIGVERIRIEGKFMDEKRVGEITRLYKKLLLLDEKQSEKEKDYLTEVEDGKITRGHYFRGVL